MYQLGHYGVALIAYAPVGATVALSGQEALAILGALLCLSLSTLPDCDHRLPLISHRGPTHTVWFALLVGGVVGASLYIFLESTMGGGDPELVRFAFGVATLSIISHLLADALTPMGITPLWPLSSWHVSLDVTPAKSTVANYALLGAGVGATVLAVFVVSSLS